MAWVNTLRLRYDALTYRWQSWVNGFNRDKQFELLNDVFGGISARKFMLVLIGSWALILGPVAFSLLRRRERRATSQTDRYYLAFCAKLARAGVTREAGETPEHFGARAARSMRPLAEQIERITRLYSALAYRPAAAADGRRQYAGAGAGTQRAPLPPRARLTRAAIPWGSSGEAAQHIVQDAPVSEIGELVGRIDADNRPEADFRALRRLRNHFCFTIRRADSADGK